MQELRNKLKRQIEILGICLSQNYEYPLKTFDLADMFNVEELTIKRDLQDIRSFGIDIHSTKKKGICLSNKMDESKLRELIHQYSALCYTESYVEKSTSLMVKRLGEKALSNMVTLQICIDKTLTAQIDYEKESEELEFRREICPVFIFQSDNYWRVLAADRDKLKQFHLNKIIEARMTDKKFVKVLKERIEDLFKYSWRSWIGPEKYNVKLKFSSEWADRLLPKQLMDTEVITQNDDGSVIFEAIVNSLDEIATWIAGKGDGVIVLEPKELKDKVIKIAQGVLGNYK